MAVRKMKKNIIIFITFIAVLLSLQFNNQHLDQTEMVMGGKLNIQSNEKDRNEAPSDKIDLEEYFRPSKLPIINDRNFNEELDTYYGKEYSEIKLPDYLFHTAEDTIINYFSLLREAANPQKGKRAGCGTIGEATLPYPVAYHFLSSEYQKHLTYNQYLETFRNILHINLIKLKKIPVYDSLNNLRYFIEIETIEGSQKDASYFAYYYGFMDLVKEDHQYKISNIDFTGENYLCAPYHGWDYDAESVVDIKYGGWCKLVKERYPTQQEDFVKRVPFKGNDGNEYVIEFYQLTNGTDLEIAQYIKKEGQDWKLIKLDPNKCLENKI